MVTHNSTKRKRPRLANDDEQELKKSNLKKPKGKPAVTAGRDNRRRANKVTAIEDDDGEKNREDEDEDDVEEEDKDDDDYDSASQKQQMMLFEERLRVIKQQKKSSSESRTSRFRKRVKEQEDALIKFLKEQRLNIKLDGLEFSRTLSVLLDDVFSSSFHRILDGSPVNSLDPIKDQLHRPHLSITSLPMVLPTRLLESTQSLQATLTAIADHGLIIGEGWERDGDLSISAVRGAQKAALLKLTEAISKNRDADAEAMKEGTAEMTWKHTVKKSEKGVKRLLKNVPVLVNTEGE